MKQVIVVTGATGGIGQLLVSGLLNEDRHIVCVGRRASALSDLVEKLKLENGLSDEHLSFQVADMSSPAEVELAASKIGSSMHRVDLWVNNVGVNNHNAIGPSWEVASDAWFEEVQLNLFTAYLGSRAAINLMKSQQHGYVVNLGGGGADTAKPFVSAYGAAKAAVVKFTEALNHECLEENNGIRAFCFNPGFIRNPRTETLVKSEVAKKYMPALEKVMESGGMSDIEDSVFLLETILSGEVSHLGGRYFSADLFRKQWEEGIKPEACLLRVSK